MSAQGNTVVAHPERAANSGHGESSYHIRKGSLFTRGSVPYYRPSRSPHPAAVFCSAAIFKIVHVSEGIYAATMKQRLFAARHLETRQWDLQASLARRSSRKDSVEWCISIGVTAPTGGHGIRYDHRYLDWIDPGRDIFPCKKAQFCSPTEP